MQEAGWCDQRGSESLNYEATWPCTSHSQGMADILHPFLLISNISSTCSLFAEIPRLYNKPQQTLQSLHLYSTMAVLSHSAVTPLANVESHMKSTLSTPDHSPQSSTKQPSNHNWNAPVQPLPQCVPYKSALLTVPSSTSREWLDNNHTSTSRGKPARQRATRVPTPVPQSKRLELEYYSTQSVETQIPEHARTKMGRKSPCHQWRHEDYKHELHMEWLLRG